MEEKSEESIPMMKNESKENLVDVKAHILIDRPWMNQEEFHKIYYFKNRGNGIMDHFKHHSILKAESSTLCSQVKSVWSHFLKRHCKMNFWQTVLHLIPILSWLTKYNFREDLLGDCVAGFTTAVLQVPQGLAYAMLAQIDAISGIYTAFFPVFIYVIFGTSRHLSMGTFAVISILVSKPVIEICSEQSGQPSNETLNTNSSGLTSELTCQMRVTVSVTFMVGFFQLMMGLFRLGFLSSLLTESLISSFTVGSAVHVVTSQVPHLLGFKIPKYVGPGRVIKSYKAIFERLEQSNMVAIGISVCCLATFLSFDFFVKPIVSKKSKIPIPIQFIVVVLTTFLAWGMSLKNDFGLMVVGDVPVGMPDPYVPFLNIELLKLVWVDSLVISIISYVVSLSMARLVATKLKYSIDANQELLSQGLSNIFGSFFKSLPVAASLSRTMVQVATGGKTQIASLVSVFLMLLIILFIGPYFYHLPRAVLSSIIIVALIGIFAQTTDLLMYFKRSCSEGFIWLTTFLAVVLLDVDYGLVAGLTMSILFMISWGFFPKIEIIQKTQFEDLFLIGDCFGVKEKTESTIVVRLSGNINTMNVTSITEKIDTSLDEHYPERSWMTGKFQNLIIDISSLTHMDTGSTYEFATIYNHFEQLGFRTLIAGTRANIWCRFESCSVFEKVPKDSFFPSIQDAFGAIEAFHLEAS